MTQPTSNVGEAEVKQLYIEATSVDYADFFAYKQSLGLLDPEEPKGFLSYIIPHYNIMNNWPRLASWQFDFENWKSMGDPYYIVFKPFNKNYDSKFDGMDQVRKKVSTLSNNFIITREIEATKIHYNVLLFSKKNVVELLHNKNTKRYMIYVTSISHPDDEDTLKHIYNVHSYIIKESKTRYFRCFEHYGVPIDIYVKINGQRHYTNFG